MDISLDSASLVSCNTAHLVLCFEETLSHWQIKRQNHSAMASKLDYPACNRNSSRHFQRSTFREDVSCWIYSSLTYYELSFRKRVGGNIRRACFQRAGSDWTQQLAEKDTEVRQREHRLGTILAALAFAALHFPDISSIPFALVFGILVGHFYDKTNNIWGQ
jgi:hypothetical protein